MAVLAFENTGGLDLAATLDCGQTFAWEPLAAGGWQGAVGGRAVRAFQAGGSLLLTGVPGGGEPGEADRGFWQDYFALDMDYEALQRRFCAGSRRLAACVERRPGIRVLRQPFFETLCCFILSQNNNIPRIRAIAGRLRAGFGRELGGGVRAFPTARALAGRSCAELAFLRAGWRAEYLLDAAGKVAGGAVSEAALRALPTGQARAALMTIKGVGPKVADCVLLYSLSRWEVMPMDVWMKKAMAALFPRGTPVCCRPYAGIAQQYIFDYARAALPRGGGKKPGKRAGTD